MSLVQALIIAAIFGWARSQFPISSFNAINSGVPIGFITGLIMGDPIKGLVIGATINAIYIGMINVGAVGVADQNYAAFLAVPIALASGLDAGQAVALAVPIGVAATLANNLEKLITVPFYSRMVGVVKEYKFNRMWLWMFAGGFAKYLMVSAIMFVGLYYGGELVSDVVKALPVWANNGFTAIGHLLPAVGIALGLVTIAKGKNDVSLAYFVIAFFAATLLDLNVLAICVIAAMFVWIIIANQIAEDKKAGKVIDLKIADGEKKQSRISPKAISRSCIQWLLYQRMILNYATYSAPPWLISMYPIIKTLYPDNPQKQSEELLKYDAYYQTTPLLNGVIQGTLIAMEEERAAKNEISVEAITSVKAGLMGPIAGFGDPIYQGVYTVILQTICIALAVNGNIMGFFLAIFGQAILYFALPGWLGNLSYKGGSRLTEIMFSSGIVDYITMGAGLLGCAAFGALSAEVVKVSTKLAFTYQDFTFDLQTSLFDAVIPGLLPLLTVLISFSLLKKGIKARDLILIYMLVGFICGSIGVLN
ncbi:MAG: PTS system mannose/fructose/sorbose family transporter subunit IID [Anaerolineaceae bacterium]|jgi:mannose/fructose/N-acetylgalactosamine-specific phosphotransferase system component IID/mannose/fructose/N-acetylgalactosamine-specific phosphotransferase system component IIC|nr:PTS system mannose/fructose/sorbose family transporter subunit IID [Anaerolineaceae bacterium]